MKALSLAVCMAVLSVGSASAVSLCTDRSNSTLAGLIANGGCVIQNRVFTFNADSYTGSGNVTPSDVNATVVANDLGDGQSPPGWMFEAATNWMTGVNLVYSVGVLRGVATDAINRSNAQLNAGVASGTPSTAAANGNSGTLPAINGAGGVAYLMSLPPANPTNTIRPGATLSSPDSIGSHGSENDFHENGGGLGDPVAAPEPRPELMFGGGLLGLAVLLRLKRVAR
jgi:hypothetical protein